MRIRISTHDNFIQAFDTQDNRRVFWRAKKETAFIPYPGNINGDPDPNDAITFTDENGQVLQLRFLENNRLLRINLLNGDNSDALYPTIQDVIDHMAPNTASFN